jgi:hypothetical protein
MYAFNDAKAPNRHLTQYFEILGNRGVYFDGWLAGTVHTAPWEAKPRRPLADDIWELYDTRSDFSLANDLGSKNPDKLKEMQAIFMREAIANHVLPIDDRRVERLNPALAGRPDLMAGRRSLTVYDGMFAISENSFINVKNTSLSITAEVVLPAQPANGALISQGGRFGGWSLYFKDSKLTYQYNYLGLKRFTIASDKPLAPGKATIVFDFDYDGGGPGRGGTGTLFANGEKIGQGRIEVTQCCAFAATEGADVGLSTGTPVSLDYTNPFKFNGKIDKVTIDLKDSKAKAVDKESIDQTRGESNLKRALSN